MHVASDSARRNIGREPVINEEKPMINVRKTATCIFCAALFASMGAAQDLSKYRDFEFGMSVGSVAELVHTSPSSAKMVHQRPQVIQTLDLPLRGYLDTSAKADSVRDIRFNFYNGELFKIVVTYDPAQTKGLTAEDLIQVLSDLYGPASMPETKIAFSGVLSYNDKEQVLARWENAEYSFNLFRSPYGKAFGLIAFSKKLELLAAAASLEAVRLDNLEAPARELARLKQKEEDEQALQEKARSANKPKFRP
jgi:hypothetical protein